MAGLSRPKDGVASLAYVPAIHVLLASAAVKTWMPGTRPGMTVAIHRIVASSSAIAQARSYSSRLIHSSIVCGSFCPTPNVTVGTS